MIVPHGKVAPEKKEQLKRKKTIDGRAKQPQIKQQQHTHLDRARKPNSFLRRGHQTW